MPGSCQIFRFLHSFSSPTSLHEILLTKVSGSRIRRIKCDETKPACVKCTSTGRTCDGYPVKGDAQRDPTANSQIVPVWAQSIPDELSVGIGGDSAERRGFHFFQFYVWPELTSELGSVYWERLILQASHADAAMRHAAIAFGSLGERLQITNVMTFDNEDANRLQNIACLHYYKAIKELRKQISSGQERSVEFTLLACFIFICFEFLQGNESAVLAHLKSGIEIIRQSDFQDRLYDPNNLPLSLNESTDFGHHVAIVFGVLDRIAANWVAAPSFGMPARLIPSLDYGPLLSEGFPNIDKANEYLNNLNSQLNRVLPAWAFVSSESNPAPKPLETSTPLIEGLRTTLDNWSRAMDAFMARSRHILSVQESQRATALMIYHRFSTLRLNTSFQASEEEPYRTSETDFNYIISMSTSLLRPIDATICFRGSENERSRRLFSFECNIIYPLYFTAIHCQDPEIQKEALSLLSTSPFREGAWDSATMARIAERRILQHKQNLSHNNLQPISHVTAGLDMTGYRLRRRQYEVGGSFEPPEDRITELGDSNRSL